MQGVYGALLFVGAMNKKRDTEISSNVALQNADQHNEILVNGRYEYAFHLMASWGLSCNGHLPHVSWPPDVNITHINPPNVFRPLEASSWYSLVS